ncbi:protein phosphatase 2c, putative, partial [Perkinsus marinus ATCC 50983]
MVTEGNAVWSRWRPLGMGFALAALSYVSQHLFRNIAAQLQNTPRQRKEGGPGEMKKLEKFVRKGFEVTEHNFTSSFGKKRKDTSTACVVVFYGPNLEGELSLMTAHLGDTRAVLCRGGKAVQLTQDHKPDNDEERKRIEALPK